MWRGIFESQSVCGGGGACMYLPMGAIMDACNSCSGDVSPYCI